MTMPGGIPGQTEDLVPTYEIMHRVFRETITPRVGNWDQVHGYLIDLLKLCCVKQGTGEKLDVMDVIFREMCVAPRPRNYTKRLCNPQSMLHNRGHGITAPTQHIDHAIDTGIAINV